MDLNLFPKSKIGKELATLCEPLLGCVKSALWTSVIFMIFISDQLYEAAHDGVALNGLPPIQSIEVLIGGIVMTVGVCFCSQRLQNGLNEFKKRERFITEANYILTGIGFYLIQFTWTCFVLSFVFSYCNLSNLYKNICFYIAVSIVIASFYVIKYFIFKNLHMKV